jgi:NAD(P)-dependent dehydrogenase (short-subunit alcohol dehydrogenase family)
MSDRAWDAVLDVNLRGVFIGCREAARRMLAAGSGGVIVNIASTAGMRGTGPGLAHYVASKHGVTGLTKQLALEFGPERIRVLGIAPSVIVTEGVQASREGKQASGGKSPTFQCVLGRLGVPDDIARVALFCASDMALYMTGATIPVDAGLLI